MSRSTFRAVMWLAFALALLQALVPMRSQAHVPDAASVMLQEICTAGGVTIGSAGRDDTDRESRSAAGSCEVCPLCGAAVAVPSTPQRRASVPGSPAEILPVPRPTRVIASLTLLRPPITGPPRAA